MLRAVALALLLAYASSPDPARADARGGESAHAIARSVFAALRCNAVQLFRAQRDDCAKRGPARALALVEDVVALAWGANAPAPAPALELTMADAIQCQLAIAVGVGRYVRRNLSARDWGRPARAAGHTAGRSLDVIERSCEVEVRRSRRGVVLPSVGAQCAAAVGEPGARVDAPALRRCLERLLSLWIDRHRSGSLALRPNIVLILTDDQRWDSIDALHSPDAEPVMRAVAERIAGAGLRFTDAFVTTPICAPSRASVMTGQYTHNHGVEFNLVYLGGGAPALDDSSTIATWLHGAGYRTGKYGKYLNRYTALWDPQSAPPYVPPGWDDWRVFDSDGGGEYYGFSLVENGAVVAYPERYSTDVLADHALAFIDESVETGRPFFVMFTPSAPHDPHVPADRHQGSFDAAPAWIPPSSFEDDVSDKPRWIRSLSGFSPELFEAVMTKRARELETLQAVDEFVDRLMDRLAAHGIADDTVVILTSDNGSAWGEHRYDSKACEYEECLRVPLLVHYPRMTPLPRETATTALNIDLAPTLAELAGVPIPSQVDGRSLVRVLDGTDRDGADEFLFERYANRRAIAFAGIHDRRWKYLELPHTRERELYDLVNDPYELENLAESPALAGLVGVMRARLLSLRPDWE